MRWLKKSSKRERKTNIRLTLSCIHPEHYSTLDRCMPFGRNLLAEAICGKWFQAGGKRVIATNFNKLPNSYRCRFHENENPIFCMLTEHQDKLSAVEFWKYSMPCKCEWTNKRNNKLINTDFGWWNVFITWQSITRQFNKAHALALHKPL